MNGLGYFYFGHLLRTASVEVDVLLALAGVAWIAGAIVYTWKRGRRLGLAAEGGHSGSHE
jgi:predicted membrane channel-forming protein YqfA (hemolysin III family)